MRAVQMCVALAALLVLLPHAAFGQKSAEPPAGPPEPESTVNATYVDPSSTTPIKPGDKVNHLFKRNMTQPYILSTDRNAEMVALAMFSYR